MPYSEEERKSRAEKKSNEAKKIRRDLEKRSLSPKGTVTFGGTITVVIIAILLAIVFLIELSIGWDIFNTWTNIGISILTVYFVYLKNFHEIPVGHKGVRLSFGERAGRSMEPKDRPLFNEGYIWTLPSPLQDLKIVDLREQNEKIDDKVILAAGINDEGEKEQAEMLTNTAIQWMVKEPYTFLDVGEDEVLDGLRTSVVSAEREVASNTAPRAFIQMKDDLGIAVDEASTTQADRWGIEILNVNVPYIRFSNPETAAAFEKAAIEARQKEAGAIETDNFLSNAEKFKIFGLKPEDAVWAAHRQEQKISGKEIRFTGNQTSDFLAGLSVNKSDGTEKS